MLPFDETPHPVIMQGEPRHFYEASPQVLRLTANPCTNLPLPDGINDFDPVLHDDTRLDDYRETLRRLCTNGWNHPERVERDVRSVTEQVGDDPQAVRYVQPQDAPALAQFVHQCYAPLLHPDLMDIGDENLLDRFLWIDINPADARFGRRRPQVRWQFEYNCIVRLRPRPVYLSQIMRLGWRLDEASAIHEAQRLLQTASPPDSLHAWTLHFVGLRELLHYQSRNAFMECEEGVSSFIGILELAQRKGLFTGFIPSRAEAYRRLNEFFETAVGPHTQGVQGWVVNPFECAYFMEYHVLPLMTRDERKVWKEQPHSKTELLEFVNGILGRENWVFPQYPPHVLLHAILQSDLFEEDGQNVKLHNMRSFATLRAGEVPQTHDLVDSEFAFISSPRHVVRSGSYNCVLASLRRCLETNEIQRPPQIRQPPVPPPPP